MSMKFNFVYSKDSLALRKVLSDLSSDCCISYQDIFNKLTKNDVYSTEPADIVVNSFLIKKLEKELISEHQNLYYIISNLENEVIENVKHFVKDYIEAEFFLYIVNEEDLSCDLFDEIYYVNSEKDKILS
jgi:hypothetical protein